MIETTLAEIAAVTGGEVHGDPALRVVAPAYLDSRAPEPGGLFVALRGVHGDGHDHAAGAHAVLGTRPTPAPTVVVADPVVALGRLARHVVRTVAPRVVAVSGSHGKTTTKDLLAALLPGAVATRGNLNNELGVPLTALRLGPDDRDLVLEMGARGVGQLSYLCDLARPDVACVTGVGSAHVGEFGSPALVAAGKGELVEALPPGGTAVLHQDDPAVWAMRRCTAAQVLGFGRRGDVRWSDLALDDTGRPTFTLHHDGRSADVRLALVGAHQVVAASAAAACALVAGVPLETAAARLSAARPSAEHRLRPRCRDDGMLVLDDSYNANPEALAAALDALVHVAGRRGGRAVAVLGRMLELGEASLDAHLAAARRAATLGVEVLWAEGADRAALPAGLAELAGRVGPRDVVLVKGSRAGRLDLLADAFVAHRASRAGWTGAAGAG